MLQRDEDKFVSSAGECGPPTLTPGARGGMRADLGMRAPPARSAQARFWSTRALQKTRLSTLVSLDSNGDNSLRSSILSKNQMSRNPERENGPNPASQPATAERLAW